MAISPNVTIICQLQPNNSVHNTNEYVLKNLICKKPVIIGNECWIKPQSGMEGGFFAGRIMEYHISDFTEVSYRELLNLAQSSSYSFITYDAYRRSGKNLLWRHDVDLSVHRARSLAQIEDEAQVVATYFFNPHSEFYNLLEKEIFNLVQEIKEIGHPIGLHFDAGFYGVQVEDYAYLEACLREEKVWLEKLLHTSIGALSFHNPEVGNLLALQQEEICGMVNSYSGYLHENYGYCSDSNGYWRFRRLREVLETGQEPRLQVLTHPGWWTPEPMSPRDRVSRCIDGRARKQHDTYDLFLEGWGRNNVR